MDGAMSVKNAANFPWLKVEKAWIRHYLSLQKPVIELCLGAQLIASAVGAQVTKNRLSEGGWSSVYKTQTITADIFNYLINLSDCNGITKRLSCLKMQYVWLKIKYVSIKCTQLEAMSWHFKFIRKLKCKS